MILLLVLFYHSNKQDRNEILQYKIFIAMLWVTILMLCVDILSRFDGEVGVFYPMINQIGNFLIFVLNPVLPSLWLLYAYSIVFPKKRIDIRLLAFVLGINAVNVVMVILTQFTGWLYYFSSNNIYHRGPIFWLSVLITVIIILGSLGFLMVNRKRIDEKYYYTLLFFLFPPLMGIFLQVAFYGMSLVLNSVVVSFLVVFLNIQNHNIYTDYLTGINNRKKLDLYMQQRIDSSSEGKTFSAILLDLNNFKSINDVYGHYMGDDALRTSVKLFCTCLVKTDFIARIGGDEFCIISDTSSKRELKKLAGKINRCFAKYNESKIRPYRLTVSMGYAVYDHQSRMTMAEFQKHIDTLMYYSKHAKRNHPGCHS